MRWLKLLKAMNSAKALAELAEVAYHFAKRGVLATNLGQIG
jgi:hypothetical protein